MTPHLEQKSHKRVRLVSQILLIWVLFVVLRLLYMQILVHSSYVERAERQQVKEVAIVYHRGSIEDRNGERLATTLPSAALGIHPYRIVNVDTAADVLSGVLGLNRQKLRTLLAEKKRENKKFIWLEPTITLDQAEALRSLPFDWISVLGKGQRFYPNGTLAAHLLGGVRHSDQRGAAGLEYRFDDLLRGKPGKERWLADSHRRGYEKVDGAGNKKAEPPADLVLTIDYMIQSMAEEALKKEVESTDCKAGGVVVMDPQTGDILAMASYPTYDPNEAIRYEDGQYSPYLNRAISEPIEPGSVMKIVTVSAALETTDVTPETVFDCTSYSRPGRVIRDVHAFGMTNVADIIARSSNVGAVKIGLQVGVKNLYDYLRRFGFGQSTGVTLPGENIGLLANGKKWRLDTLESASMGHAVSVNVLQMARAVSVIANGGKLVTPRIVKSIEKPGEAPVEVSTTPPIRVIRPETAITMRHLMERVILNGTGQRAHLVGYTSGGKTGSAEIFDKTTGHYLKNENNGSFVGFAPVTNPRIVVAVSMFPTSHYGGTVAGPVFKSVATGALRLLDVPHDALPSIAQDGRRNGQPGDDGFEAEGGAMRDIVPEESPFGAPQLVQASLTGSAWQPPSTPVLLVGPRVPDFRGKSIRQVLEEAGAKGLAVEAYGEGIARRQSPVAGSILPPGNRVLVVFQR